MALLSRSILTPLLLTYETNSSYLNIDSQGCTLFMERNPEPVYQIQEPLLLAHGIMTDSKTVHLVILKTNGDLSYTLISGTAAPQTTVIAKLDVRGTRYRRLFLIPQGKMIHIFYASNHKSIPGLWRIQHRFWNGNTWHSTHMGEVVNPREPLFHVSLDSQGNLHFLTVTFQGRYSLLFTNRFNGTFCIWGSPTETMKISGEVIDIATLMTSDNIHHLFWIVKTSAVQFELRSAQQTEAQELASAWHPAPAPIKTFNTPIKNIGALEINGILWLLAYTGEEILMQNDGTGWKLVSSHTPFRQIIQWVHKGSRNFFQTCWLEDQNIRHAPAYYSELGYNIQYLTPPAPYQTVSHQPSQVPPPVPAFYPDQPYCNSLSVAALENVSSASPTKTTSHELDAQILNESLPNSVGGEEAIPITSFEVKETNSNSETNDLGNEPMMKVGLQLLSANENEELQSLMKTVAHLEQENSMLNLAVQNMLSKFDQIIEVISENGIQIKSPDFQPLDELEPVMEAMSQLENSLEKLESQVSQLQSEKANLKTKGGFWNKWIT